MIYDGNEIINGGFEYLGAGGTDVFAWWQESAGSTGSTIEAETSIVYSGSYSCKMTRVGTTPPSITQNIEVWPGQKRRFTFWTRGDGAVALSYRIYDQTNGANIVAETTTGVTAATWTQVTVDITVPAGCYTIWIRFISASPGGSCYIDDVRSWVPMEHLPIISRFGDTWATAEELPLGAASVPHGAGRNSSTLLALPSGGSYDFGRTEVKAISLPQAITIQGQWKEASEAEMLLKAARLNALLGTRSKLWRDFGGNNQHWRWARCVGVTGDISHDQRLMYAEFQMEFELDAGPWHGQDRSRTWTLANAAGGPGLATIVCRNYGNAPVRDVKMTITAGSADMTSSIAASHRIVRDAASVTGFTNWWVNGTIASGLSLEIDNGAGTILLDGVDNYAGLVLGEYGHSTPDWFYLEPGRNAFAFSYLGGGTGSTVLMEYEDGWL